MLKQRLAQTLANFFNCTGYVLEFTCVHESLFCLRSGATRFKVPLQWWILRSTLLLWCVLNLKLLSLQEAWCRSLRPTKSSRGEVSSPTSSLRRKFFVNVFSSPTTLSLLQGEIERNRRSCHQKLYSVLQIIWVSLLFV